MGGLLKLLGGAVGPYFFGALATIAALAALMASVQSARLDQARRDLATAQAALIDPATKRKWEQLAKDSGADLIQCRLNTVVLDAGRRSQNAAVDVWKAHADRTAQDLARVRQEAAQSHSSAQREARIILAAKPGPDACKSADTLILEQLK